MSYVPPPPRHPAHAQFQAAVDPQLPYLERADCALPPGYRSSWDEVRRKSFFPSFFKANLEAFRSYLMDALILESGWFQYMKADIERHHNTSDLLWPNTVHLPDPGDDVKHWSIGFLRYHVFHNDRLEKPPFACEIFLEVIFILLTPDPATWIGGCQLLGTLTGWTEKAVEGWFKKRRANADSNQLESNFYTQTVAYPYTSGSVDINIQIRNAAFLYILDNVPGMQWDLGVFNFCLNYLLKGMAEARATRPGRCVPHRSVLGPLIPIQRPHFHGIYVGPLSRHSETRWTSAPLSDLYEIQERHYTFGRKTDKFPKPDSFLIPKDHRYRVFLFRSENIVQRYLKRWTQGRIDSHSRYSRVTVELYDAVRHSPLPHVN